MKSESRPPRIPTTPSTGSTAPTGATRALRDDNTIPQTAGNGFMTVKDVARLLGMSERWIHERTRRREIPCYRFGTALRFDPEEIRDWAAKFHDSPEGG